MQILCNNRAEHRKAAKKFFFFKGRTTKRDGSKGWTTKKFKKKADQ